MAKAKTKAGKAKEISLEDALWNCRVALRGVGSMEKNRDAVISLVFLKFAGDKFERRRAELIQEYGDVPAFLEKPSFYNAVNVFYLDEESRWSYLVKEASANDIAIKIDRAMALAEERNPSLKGALPLNHFATLGAEQSSLKKLIDSINDISEDRYSEEDLIGRVYEYFLQIFAVGASKEDGEYYTPACVVKLIAELIEPYSGVVYDPCCGSGGMFVQSHKFVESHHGDRAAVSVVGQESNPDTWRLCKMNLAIRGIANDLGDEAASSFTRDKHKNRDHTVDYIMANPPFNLKDWRGENELLKDSRWSAYELVPPVANANYAWVLHMLSKLDTTHGIAGFLLANGALNADGTEHDIRKKLIEDDRIEAIIVLPRNMFYTNDISVTLWIVNMDKGAKLHGERNLRDRTHEVLFVDLRSWGQNIVTYTYDKNMRKKKVVFSDSQIEEIKQLYFTWQEVDGGYKDIPELCKAVRLEGDGGLRANDYTLTPSKYIEFLGSLPDNESAAAFDNLRNDTRALLAEASTSLRSLEGALQTIESPCNGEERQAVYALRDLIEQNDERNTDLALGLESLRGISIEKKFIESKANMVGVSLTPYKLVLPGHFAYVTVTSRNGEKITIAYNDTDATYIVSSSYIVFSIKRPDIIDAEYLAMYFNRPDFDRYARFNSWGSARETFNWEDMQNVTIHLPSLERQKAAANIYRAYLVQQRTSETLAKQLHSLCPFLVDG